MNVVHHSIVFVGTSGAVTRSIMRYLLTPYSWILAMTITICSQVCRQPNVRENVKIHRVVIVWIRTKLTWAHMAGLIPLPRNLIKEGLQS